MTLIPPSPARGDIITLEAPRERSAVAVVVGFSKVGALRIRPLSANPAAMRIRTYRGAWRPLPITDPRHPAFDPCQPADPGLPLDRGL